MRTRLHDFVSMVANTATDSITPKWFVWAWKEIQNAFIKAFRTSG
jgi:hypothetical protein